MSPRRLASAWLLAILGGCAIEAPPTVPGAPERRALVVPWRLDAEPQRRGSEDPPTCSLSCPPADAGEELADCHPASLSPELDAHRLALGEAQARWLVCSYEAR
jgi:hypothetical protein